MISIIICSRNSDFVKRLSANIQSTIGVPYELIIKDNSLNPKGICEAYNSAASESIYDILCFMHEDIIIKTSDWGITVSTILEDLTIGLLGVAGATYKSGSPCPWWEIEPEYLRMNINQHYKGISEAVREIKNPHNNRISDVVLIDGVWFCCRKEVWKENKFDFINFPGFHFYDLDFSAQVYRKYRITVTYEILIEHFSQGTLDVAWTDSSLKYSKKWKCEFPFMLDNESTPLEKIKKMEGRAIGAFLRILIEVNGDKIVQIQYLFKYIKSNSLTREARFLIKKAIKNLLGI